MYHAFREPSSLADGPSLPLTRRQHEMIATPAGAFQFDRSPQTGGHNGLTSGQRRTIRGIARLSSRNRGLTRLQTCRVYGENDMEATAKDVVAINLVPWRRVSGRAGSISEPKVAKAWYIALGNQRV